MATSREIPETGALTYDGFTQLKKATRRFRVDTATNENEAIQATGVVIGNTHPRLAGIVAVRYRVSPTERYIWDVEWEYSNEQGDDGGGGGGGGSQFTGYTTSFREIWQDAWRSGPTSPSGDFGSVGQPIWGGVAPIGDIGGDHIDSAGAPVSVGIKIQQADIPQFVGNPFRAYETIRRCLNKRNDRPWLGAPKGTLLYVGADATQVPGGAKIVHHFQWDGNYHCRQQAWRDPNSGDVVPGDDGTAKQVVWIQPYPDLENFNILGINLNGTGG